ncbi:4-hydroxybenzoate octaprenyltransferase [Gemmobacter lutimaris]|uniref:4-hydroxybenzoate octaprenyltransferase n=1 Tax=Gemmobacter lutimaris TaxID=2306023 RepID=A0A398BRD8_9RHOB|nr:4-hydroxybenzoate octaprenyltransferase [Gemmobacter lutimaris]RID92324.1 4-hydroxybenzoate octaprenyltransferase [Gemmobacter lutimaris]
MTERAKTPEAQASVADAPKGNWVDLYAPAALRPYLRLSRADRPIGTWLLLLPCYWGLWLAAAADPAGIGWRDLWIFAGCTLGAAVMRGAGCTWNDITDREFDAAVARTRSRPLPSGQVTVRQAVVWMALQCLIGAAILFTFTPMAITLGVASLALVAIYPFAKRFTWWPQFFLGLAFNWGALVAWTAHTGSLSLPPVILWVAGIIWTLFYDTIYAHQDKEDDALIGVKSTARLFGDESSRLWLTWFMIGAVSLAALAVIAALIEAGSLWPMALGLLGVMLFAWHLRWQLARLDTTDTENCLWLFRSNRDAGLILALFLAGAATV